MVPEALSKRIHGVIGLMLIYGNTPRDIMAMIWRRRYKFLTVIAVIVIAVMLAGCSTAKAKTSNSRPWTSFGTLWAQARIQQELNRKANMKKLIFAVIVLSIGYFTIAKAEETKSITPQEFVDTIASVPGKIGEQINKEIEKTKEYQAKNWADAKAQWQRLLSKFQAN